MGSCSSDAAFSFCVLASQTGVWAVWIIFVRTCPTALLSEMGASMSMLPSSGLRHQKCYHILTTGISDLRFRRRTFRCETYESDCRLVKSASISKPSALTTALPKASQLAADSRQEGRHYPACKIDSKMGIAYRYRTLPKRPLGTCPWACARQKAADSVSEHPRTRSASTSLGCSKLEKPQLSS